MLSDTFLSEATGKKQFLFLKIFKNFYIKKLQ